DGGGAGQDPNRPGQPIAVRIDRTRLTLRPWWEVPRRIEVEEGAGGHGGGDRRLLNDLFGGKREPDPLGRAATHLDGAYAMLVGAAANQSFATGLPVRIRDLVRFPGR